MTSVLVAITNNARLLCYANTNQCLWMSSDKHHTSNLEVLKKKATAFQWMHTAPAGQLFAAVTQVHCRPAVLSDIDIAVISPRAPLRWLCGIDAHHVCLY